MTDNTNRNFKGQLAQEEVLVFSRRHWIVIFPYLVSLFFIPFMFVAVFLNPVREFFQNSLSETISRITVFLIIVGMTYLIHRTFVQLLNYYFRIFIITNLRIINLDKTLVFSNNRDAIDLSKIQDTILRQDGILKTILNYGDITITLPAVNMVKTLHYVPNPEYYFRKINKTQSQERIHGELRLESSFGGSSAILGTPESASSQHNLHLSNKDS